MDRKIIFFLMSIIGLLFFAVVQAVSKSGDVILGGLFNVHQFPGEEEEAKEQCGELDAKGFGLAMAMIFAIETINDNSNLLPNVTLGYDVRDYCENTTKAMEITFGLIKDKTCSNITRTKMVSKTPIALIGPYESRTALAINGFLQMLDFPAISGTTTSPELSKSAYNHLYRTAPTDTFLGKAVADIIEHFKWTYVAAVALDDSYGRNGVWSVIKEAATRNSSFCVAMTEFIPFEGQIASIRNIVSILRRRKNIMVIILWTYGSHQRNFFREVDRQNLTGRVWILSGSVSVTSKTFGYRDTSIINRSIGFQPHRFYDAGFAEYITEFLNKGTNSQFFSQWWSEAKALTRSCPTRNQSNTQHGVCIKRVVQDIYGPYIPYVIDAVYSAAHAIEIGLAEGCTNKTDDYCQQPLNIDLLSDMQQFLSRIFFKGLSGNVTFDEFGDRGSAVYDILNFQQVEGTDGKLRLLQTIVGKWEANGQNNRRMHFNDKMRWNSANNSAPKSECLDQCPEGTRKSITSPCCWHCVPCPRGTINPISGSENCNECPRGKLPNGDKTKCVDLPLINMKYSSLGGIVVLAIVAMGIVGTSFSLAVCCRFWNTPIVRASNRTLSLVLLVIILMMLSLTLMNLIEPTDAICKIIYPWRYITYNLCLSILLVKVLRISSAFQIPITPCCTISSFTSRTQLMVVITLQVILLLVLLPWLLVDPPVIKKHILTHHYIFVECNAYNNSTGKILFLLTFSCILLQTLLCAFSSFKIRNVPENLGEAKRIAFSMYIFTFSLLAYHPVEFSMDGWYVTVVDCVTTLLTSYGFLCCIFLPKIYVIIFRPELNNLTALSQQVTNYSFGTSSIRVNPALSSSTG